LEITELRMTGFSRVRRGKAVAKVSRVSIFRNAKKTFEAFPGT
jgi:hypothetical protein